MEERKISQLHQGLLEHPRVRGGFFRYFGVLDETILQKFPYYYPQALLHEEPYETASTRNPENVLLGKWVFPSSSVIYFQNTPVLPETQEYQVKFYGFQLMSGIFGQESDAFLDNHSEEIVQVLSFRPEMVSLLVNITRIEIIPRDEKKLEGAYFEPVPQLWSSIRSRIANDFTFFMGTEAPNKSSDSFCALKHYTHPYGAVDSGTIYSKFDYDSEFSCSSINNSHGRIGLVIGNSHLCELFDEK